MQRKKEEGEGGKEGRSEGRKEGRKLYVNVSYCYIDHISDNLSQGNDFGCLCYRHRDFGLGSGEHWRTRWRIYISTQIGNMNLQIILIV